MIVPRLSLICWHLLRGGAVRHWHQAVPLTSKWGRFLLVTDRFFARRCAKNSGKPLADALTRLGPGFIKIGQILATRADLLGKAATDLARLQDRLHSVRTTRVDEIIRNETGKNIDQIFCAFDPTPFAAGSVAETYAATLHDGRKVAVKILRQGIRAEMARNIADFRLIARLATWITPDCPFKLGAAVDHFARRVDIELDLRLEAAASGRLATNHLDDKDVAFSAIAWSLTSEKMLVSDHAKGIRVDDRDGLLEAGHNIDRLSETLAEIFLRQVFRDGFFHGDMHPGNILVRADGIVTMVDFGIMGQLRDSDRLFLAQLLESVLDRNYSRIERLYLEAGFFDGEDTHAGFAEAVEKIFSPLTARPLSSASLGAVLGAFLRLGQQFDLVFPPRLGLLHKNLIMIEGVIRALSPRVNLWEVAARIKGEWTSDDDDLTLGLSEIIDEALACWARSPLIGPLSSEKQVTEHDYTVPYQ